MSCRAVLFPVCCPRPGTGSVSVSSVSAPGAQTSGRRLTRHLPGRAASSLMAQDLSLLGFRSCVGWCFTRLSWARSTQPCTQDGLLDSPELGPTQPCTHWLGRVSALRPLFIAGPLLFRHFWEYYSQVDCKLTMMRGTVIFYKKSCTCHRHLGQKCGYGHTEAALGADGSVPHKCCQSPIRKWKLKLDEGTVGLVTCCRQISAAL